jgi:hypothetical protein
MNEQQLAKKKVLKMRLENISKEAKGMGLSIGSLTNEIDGAKAKAGESPKIKRSRSILRSMERVKKFLSRFFDIICFVIGPFIAVICFSYFYRPQPRYQYAGIGISIGVALICIGILRKYWAKKD